MIELMNIDKHHDPITNQVEYELLCLYAMSKRIIDMRDEKLGLIRHDYNRDSWMVGCSNRRKRVIEYKGYYFSTRLYSS
jgi:hypothetical protein